MNANEQWKHILLRAVTISGVVVFVGYILYGGNVFTPTMKASQFMASGITAGLSYAFWKSEKPWNMYAALFCWYIAATFLLIDFNRWLLILNLSYIGCIASAVVLNNFVAGKPFAKNFIVRIFFAGAIIAIANGVIIVILGMFSYFTIINRLSIRQEALLFNVKIGSVIGLAAGAGIELAEYFNGALVEYEQNIEEESDEEESETDEEHRNTD